MRRRTALATGWLATTVLATAVCAVAVSLVTSDLTEPRREALALAELRSLDTSVNAAAGSTPAQPIDLDLAVDQAPDAARASQTFVSRGGVLVASCPAPVRLSSVRPHDGFRVVVDESSPGVIEVRFVRSAGTELHLLSCGPDGIAIESPGAVELAGPTPVESRGSVDHGQDDDAEAVPDSQRDDGRTSKDSWRQEPGRPGRDDDDRRGRGHDRTRSERDDGRDEDDRSGPYDRGGVDRDGRYGGRGGHARDRHDDDRRDDR